MFRPSCAKCPFASVSRAGDITMADFWGIEKHDSAFNDNRGVSLVLVNSSVGAEIFENARKNFDYFQANVMDCLQPNLVSPSVPSPCRQRFWKDYQQLPFSKLLKKYTSPSSVPARVKKLIKKALYRFGLRAHP